MTKTICINFHIPALRSLHIKFEVNGLNGLFSYIDGNNNKKIANVLVIPLVIFNNC